ncbi:MAG: potassium channel family protein [Candidatus Obscuribacterales bacterium]|nr:potassium channel family protein [Candidatus Obscuribacterales bacterium]
MNFKEKMQQFLLRNKERANNLLFLLSCLALALFASNELAAIKPNVIPVNQENWDFLQLLARFAVWSGFLMHFLSYGFLSGSPWKYAREHFLELLVCIAWFPQPNMHLLRDLTQVLSLESLQLIGTLANGYLLVRHIVRNLSTHPVIVTGSVFLFVIVAASELLMQVEPQTFPNLFDAIWYSMVTTTTIGYGDIVPKTPAGRCIGMVLMLSGISLAAAFIGIVSQFMQKRLGNEAEHKEVKDLRLELSAERNRNQRLLDALERNNELSARILAELEKQSKAKSEIPNPDQNSN